MKISRKLIVGAGAVALIAAGGGAALADGGGASSPQPPAPHATPGITPASPIDTTTESKYTPITPCRVVDTRVGGGVVAAGTTRSWFVAGTTGFVGQGGTSGGCGVPDSATAVAVTVTAVNATGSGFVRIWPYGSSEPAATFMNFSHAFNVSSGGNLTLDTAGTRDVTAKVYGHATHVVIDVIGYYLKPMTAFINQDGTVLHGSRVTGGLHLVTGGYEVDFDRDVSACTYTATPFYAPYTIEVHPRATNVHGVYVQIEAPSSTTTDVSFYLDVTC